MKKDDNKTVQDKNGLRNYGFEQVRKGKRVYHVDPIFPNVYQEFTNFFYTKKCLFCNREFEANRIDTAFCCQSCHKAHLRLKKKVK